jgi:hypothetical protein
MRSVTLRWGADGARDLTVIVCKTCHACACPLLMVVDALFWLVEQRHPVLRSRRTSRPPLNTAANIMTAAADQQLLRTPL